MRKRFTQVLTTLALIALTMTVFTNQASAEKKILIEQFTGAWCGWCVDGSLVMDSLVQEYPDKVIGVKFHNGDPMAIPEDAALGGFVGRSFFPSGAIDREFFNVEGTNAIALSRTIWRQAVESLLNKEAKVEVSCDWYIDKAEERIVATIKTEFLVQMVEDVRLNVYICEDSVTGGSDYDQSNAYSNRQGHEFHPYFSKPGIISGYVHEKVVRFLAGGIAGIKGPLPAGILAGNEYEYTFEIDIDPTWNLDEVYALGVVQLAPATNSSPRKIYNSCYATKQEPTTEITYEGSVVDVKEENNVFEQQFTIKNISDEDITYDLSFSTSDRTPEDWELEVTLPDKVLSGKSENPLADEVDIDAGKSVDVTLSFTSKVKIGLGDAYLIVDEKNNADAVRNAVKMTLVSAEIESFEIIDDNERGIYSMHDVIESTDRDQYFTLSSRVFLEVYQDIKANKSLKYMVWNCGNRGSISYQEADKVANLVEDNLGVLFTGALTIPMLKLNYPSHILAGYVGLDWNPDTDQIQNVSDFTMEGVDDDPITDGLIIPGCSRDAGQTYYLQELDPIDTEITKQMLEIKNYWRYIGFHTQTLEYRAAVFSFNLPIITDEVKRKILVDNTLTWLEEIGDMPKILISKSKMDFGRIEINKSAQQTVDITNVGGSDLHIDDIYLDWNDDMAYSVDKHAPIIIPVGEKVTLTVTFLPSFANEFKAFLNISHNASSYDESIQLKGVGGEAYDGPKLATNLEENKLDFGDVQAGQPKNEIVIMRNIGSEKLSLFDVAIINDPDKVFKLIGTYSGTEIPSKGAKNLTIQFTPKTSGEEYSGQVIIQSDDVEIGQLFIFLSGKGAKGDLGPVIETNTVDNKIDFGEVEMNKSKTIGFKIDNAGDADLIIDEIKLTDPDGVFSFSGEAMDITIEADDSYTFDVRLSGTEKGNYTGTLAIGSNAENAADLHIELIGKIKEPSSIDDILSTNDPLALEIYPNPTNGNFALNYYNNTSNSTYRITITDANGSIVILMANTQLSQGYGSINVDCGNLASGKYILFVESNGVVAQKQVVIIK